VDHNTHIRSLHMVIRFLVHLFRLQTFSPYLLFSVVMLARRFFKSPLRFHSTVSSVGKRVRFTFVNRDGSRTPVEAPVGKSVLEVAHENNVELEGACEGSMACSTCHVILTPDLFEKLDEPCEREEDLLDLAPGLTDTSRLSCQVKVDEKLEGTEIRLPRVTLNFYVDGHVPKPH
jgi:ferredoxin